MNLDHLPAWDTVDDDIVAALRAMHERRDPMPPGLTDDVKFALTVQALHADVAELTRLTPAGVRADTDYTRATNLTFSGGDLTAMVSITADGPRLVRIDGWVTGGPVRVELRERERTRSVETDDTGRFVFDDVASGIIQFVLFPLDQPDTNPIITPSFDV